MTFRPKPGHVKIEHVTRDTFVYDWTENYSYLIRKQCKFVCKRLHYIFKKEFPTIGVMFFGVPSTEQEPDTHRPGLHCQENHLQAIIDPKNYITSDVLNSEKYNVM